MLKILVFFVNENTGSFLILMLMSRSTPCTMRADDVNTSKYLYSVNGIPVSNKFNWNSRFLTEF